MGAQLEQAKAQRAGGAARRSGRHRSENKLLGVVSLAPQPRQALLAAVIGTDRSGLGVAGAYPLNATRDMWNPRLGLERNPHAQVPVHANVTARHGNRLAARLALPEQREIIQPSRWQFGGN